MNNGRPDLMEQARGLLAEVLELSRAAARATVRLEAAAAELEKIAPGKRPRGAAGASPRPGKTRRLTHRPTPLHP